MLLAVCQLPQAAHAADHDAVEDPTEIRAEEERETQIPYVVHTLADGYGSRLTGSPAAADAARWAVEQLRAWGLSDAHLEPWVFGHPGWRNVGADGQLLLPTEQPLSFGVTAWTPGTNGPVTAQVALIDPPQETTAKALEDYLRSVRGTVKGRIVMIGRGQVAVPAIRPATIDAQTVALLRDGKAAPYTPETPDPDILTRRQREERIDAFLVEAGATVRVDDAARPYGVLAARANFTFNIEKAVPSVVLRNEDYGRISRLLDDGRPVEIRFDIRNVSNADGRIAYNVVADIPGSDKSDELVILGAHLDSWHLSPGAVDDAVGVAIMMEVGRLIHKLDPRPRRTIRIVLWSGEEQYLLGSQAYVTTHFGTAENPLDGFDRVAAYINIDNGSGRIRGANIFGPPDAAAMLRNALRPVADLGIEGVIPHGVRRLGSTDATTFSRAGLTAIGLIQDPLDYSTARHGDVDTFERVDEAQARQAAIVTTVLALALANQETMPQKFDADTMPAPIGPPPTAERSANWHRSSRLRAASARRLWIAKTRPSAFHRKRTSTDAGHQRDWPVRAPRLMPRPPLP